MTPSTLWPERAWTAAVDADGEIRDGAQVAELTGLLDLSRWPDGMRVIVRREKPHPGAGLTLFEQADGWRYQAFATNTTPEPRPSGWLPRLLMSEARAAADLATTLHPMG